MGDKFEAYDEVLDVEQIAHEASILDALKQTESMLVALDLATSADIPVPVDALRLGLTYVRDKLVDARGY